jgi:hypothetical protein
VSDATEDLFDLSDAEIRIKTIERAEAVERSVRVLQPCGRFLAAPKHLFDHGRNAPETEQSVGLVRPEDALFLATGQ